MSHGKQFTLYTHWGGANGWKVAYVVAALGLTYAPIYLDFDQKEQKSPEFLKLNPNGRIPAIIDHENGDFVLWESNAILLYLVDRYDKDHKLSAATEAEKALQNQWLFFQASGQGPYFGQFYFFNFSSPVKVPSAVKRYKDETERVFGVLNDVLSKQEWSGSLFQSTRKTLMRLSRLVGNKMTIADISFIPWNALAFEGILDYPVEDKFPAVHKWHADIISCPAIKAAIKDRAVMVKKFTQ
ncbi:glutathione S-transferase [Calocera viscosa TUFC12733]|uniref:Glutathione S-transferase n=1 Tax=Calocera viscosa (strain TUFC12733) TaxID=1330018 RepID=A0A167J6S1_CALVF|nr:glutathione S-transferase [Calocera viscosa TUFC12733]